MQECLDNFPIADIDRNIALSVPRIVRSAPTTYDFVVQCHAALITQLKLFLRAQ
jgi:hypothetical protein